MRPETHSCGLGTHYQRNHWYFSSYSNCFSCSSIIITEYHWYSSSSVWFWSSMSQALQPVYNNNYIIMQKLLHIRLRLLWHCFHGGTPNNSAVLNLMPLVTWSDFFDTVFTFFWLLFVENALFCFVVASIDHIKSLTGLNKLYRSCGAARKTTAAALLPIINGITGIPLRIRSITTA